ncbi:MAG: NAD(P)/FAD-dependent oxidoreductase [bacterium]
MAEEQFDLLVIGGGTAGLAAARAANARGLRVALADSTRLGGDCLWWTCLPTKALLVAAQARYAALQAGELGIDIPTANVDFTRVQERKAEVLVALAVADSTAAVTAEGITLFKGRAAFVDPHRVRVRDTDIVADQIVLATGAFPWLPPIPGLADIKFLTYMRAVGLSALPASIIVIGGGAVGCEFAQLFSRLGVKVTLVETCARLLLNDEPESSALAAQSLRADGITVYLNAHVRQALQTENDKSLLVDIDGESLTLSAAEVLVATGRKPQLDGLNPTAAGLTVERGRLSVQATLQTNVPHIWACGDVAGGPQFRPLAEAQGAHVGAQAGADAPAPFTMLPLAHTTFIDPEIAGVGLTEDDARATGMDVVIGYAPFSTCDRAVIAGNSAGFVKLVVDRQNGTLLGGHLVGHNAGEMIHELALALAAKLSVRMIADLPRVYPSLATAVQAAAQQAANKVYPG